MASRPTVSDLRALKGKRQILTMHVDNALEAAAGAEAGIDMFTFEVDDRIEGVRAAAPHVFIQAGCRQAIMASEASAIREAFRAMERGVDGIYFAGSLQIVESMAREGIPVTGHVGYVPVQRTWTGVRAVGKTPEEAAAVFRKVKALENAGAWAVEMEIVPVEIADFITRNTSLITEGMGCGSVCDAQYLFSCDVLGTNTGHFPRHAKKYADLAAEEARLQKIRVDAFKAFAEDIKSGHYPEASHEVRVAKETFKQFLALIGG
jgi:3-methyl-2-oxobutanoate hydroxymethyltransferase